MATPETAKSHHPREIELSAEDRARLSRLYEEVAGRGAEISLILARILGWDSRHKLFTLSLAAGFPWATVAKSEKIRHLLTFAKTQTEGKAADSGSDAGSAPGAFIYNSENGASGWWDESTGTCHE